MAYGCMKRCSTSLIIRRCKLKQPEKAVPHITEQLPQREEIWFYIWLYKNLRKIKIDIVDIWWQLVAVWASNSTSALFLKELKSQSERWASTPLFTIAFFTVVKVQTCAMKHYSVVEKNKILSFRKTWMKPNNTIITRIARHRKKKGHMN